MQNILNKKRKGFTLIELIVVIAIIGILVLLATPKFMDYTRDAKDAKTQHDARVADDAVTERLVGNDDKLPEGLTEVTPGDIQAGIEEGRVFNPEGPVAEVPEGPYSDVTDMEEVKAGGIKTDGRIIANGNGDVFIILDKAIRTDVCVLRADQKIEDAGSIINGTYPNTLVMAKYPDADFYEYQDYVFIRDMVSGSYRGSEYDLLLVDYIGSDDNLIVPGFVGMRHAGGQMESWGAVTAIDDVAFIEKSITIAELPCTITGTMASGVSGDETSFYTEAEIDALILAGWIPVATADELQQINDISGTVKTWGAGTQFEMQSAGGMDQSYIQVANIDLASYGPGYSIYDGQGWFPIGYYWYTDVGLEWNSFTGNYDGGDFNITNLYINRPDQNYIGLFGQSEGPVEFKNINIISPQIYVGANQSDAGALLGIGYKATTGPLFENISVEGLYMEVQNEGYYLGGLTGESWGSSMNNVNIDGTISLIGNSYTIGGVAGDYSGNMVAVSSRVNITDISKTSKQIGGIAGTIEATIERSDYSGNIVGGLQIGGIAGDEYAPSLLMDTYSTGSIDGVDYLGGALGGSSYGTTDASIVNSHSMMQVSGTGTNVGGLVGENTGTVVTNSYYYYDAINSYGTKVTEADMANLNTFTGWDFDSVWIIDTELYPTHR